MTVFSLSVLLWPSCPVKLGVVTFSTPNIAAYADYFTTINQQYASAKGYTFLVASEETISDWNYEDVRWNKVQLLIDLVAPCVEHSSPCAFDYFVFVDADLVVLDFGLDLVSVFETHGGRDLIMTEDNLDVANTGIIFVRPSESSLAFLRQWQKLRFLPYVHCDQHALNALSLQLKAQELGRAWQVVDREGLNSLWPPLEHFDPRRDRVLHLLGEREEVREALAQDIFRRFSALFRASADVREQARLRVALSVADLDAVKRAALRSAVEKLLSIDKTGAGDGLEALVPLLEHYCAYSQRLRASGEREDHCLNYLHQLQAAALRLMNVSDILAHVRVHGMRDIPTAALELFLRASTLLAEHADSPLAARAALAAPSELLAGIRGGSAPLAAINIPYLHQLAAAQELALLRHLVHANHSRDSVALQALRAARKHQRLSAEGYLERRQFFLASSARYAYLDTLQRLVEFLRDWPGDRQADEDAVLLCDEGVLGAHRLHDGREFGDSAAQGPGAVLERRLTATLLQRMCSVCEDRRARDQETSCVAADGDGCGSFRSYPDMCGDTQYYHRPEAPNPT
eukprot:gene27954-33757_t